MAVKPQSSLQTLGHKDSSAEHAALGVSIVSLSHPGNPELC